MREHGVGRSTHLAIKTEDRNAERRINEIGRLDHVVLLVAAQTVLWTERCGHLQAGRCRERIETMPKIGRHRGWVGEQPQPATDERCTQTRIFEQTIDAELDHVTPTAVKKFSVR